MVDDEHLLARIDERVKHIEQMVLDFVRRHEFKPVQQIAFGMVALLLSAVVAAIVAQVIK
jgi:translation elongation factor EF-1beta